MGCHTWFCRPLTRDEFELMKEYAPTEIYNLTGNKEDLYDIGLYDEALYKNLMKSYNENLPCVYGKYWWQYGYGGGNPKIGKGEDDFVFEICGETGLFLDVDYYHDIFRVNNYPRKVIHNKRELRRFMRKRYFGLSKEQLIKISEFFAKYPGGVIHFG